MAAVAESLPHPPGFRPVTFSAGPDGEAVYLAVGEGDLEEPFGTDVQPGWAVFPKSRAEHPFQAAVTINDGRDARHILIEDVETSFPRLQPLPHGKVLLVSSRCCRFADGSVENNARVYDESGQLVGEFCLGDGIEDVQASGDGAIWVSYFDEGVFGNFGWGAMGVGEPIGSAGLACFDTTGVAQWTYRPPPNIGTIDDCYALNVAEDATWAYYYSDFPLVRIGTTRQIKAWSTEVSGAKAFAVWGDRVLLFGGYEEQRLRCTLWQLGASKLVNPKDFRLILPTGNAFEGGAVVGRGPILRVFVGAAWYQVDLRTLSP